MSVEKDFTIGCDPEFICFEGKEKLSAEDYPERNCFGSDGGGVAFEVRADYSSDTLRVVNNIHKTFLQLVAKEPDFLDYTWKAGSFVDGNPIGGHIHFGNVNNLSVSAACEWLDQFVGSCTVLIEDKTEGTARREGDYGSKGDHRTNDHGFEYRTASSWLTSPYVAASVLCLAKAVIHQGITENKKSPPTFITAEDINEMQVNHIRSKFDDIWSAITKLKLYHEY